MKIGWPTGRFVRWALIAIFIVITSTPLILAEGSSTTVVEADILFTSPIPSPASQESLVVQATFLEGPTPCMLGF